METQLDQAVRFMEEFALAENEAARAQYTERDEAVFQAALRRMEGYFAPGMSPDVNDPQNRDADFFASHEPAVGNLKPRRLQQVKQYHHPQLGALFRCYVNNYISLGPKVLYFGNFYHADQGEGLRIIASYLVCRHCAGLGQVEGDACSECEGRGWHWVRGMELETLGRLIEVRKLLAPDKPEHLQDYLAE
jgi:hypothetical protein